MIARIIISLFPDKTSCWSLTFDSFHRYLGYSTFGSNEEMTMLATTEGEVERMMMIMSKASMLLQDVGDLGGRRKGRIIIIPCSFHLLLLVRVLVIDGRIILKVN